MTAHDVSSLHGSQAYAHAVAGSSVADKGMGGRRRLQAGGEQDDSRLQVPMNVSSSYRWLEDAITEWQVCSVEQGEASVASGKWGRTGSQGAHNRGRLQGMVPRWLVYCWQEVEGVPQKSGQ